MIGNKIYRELPSIIINRSTPRLSERNIIKNKISTIINEIGSNDYMIGTQQ
jgi:hypothetical protein